MLQFYASLFLTLIYLTACSSLPKEDYKITETISTHKTTIFDCLFSNPTRDRQMKYVIWVHFHKFENGYLGTSGLVCDRLAAKEFPSYQDASDYIKSMGLAESETPSNSYPTAYVTR